MPVLVAPLVFAMAQAQATTAARSVPDAQQPSYDVSTIKLNNSDSHNASLRSNLGVYTAENAPLKYLISNAFDIRQDLVFGLPDWTEKVHYDIVAKDVDADSKQMEKLTPEQRRIMNEGLLRDRFALRWHYETRVLPAYELVLDQNGLKLKPAPAQAGKMDTWNAEDNSIQATEISMETFVTLLADTVHRSVVDRTGLAARYDVDLHFRRVEDDPSENGGQQNGDSLPDIYTALREQLGLHLKTGRDPIRVLVIDHIEPPTAN